MQGTYNVTLVALSVVVAVFVSFISLKLAARVSSARGALAWVWLIGGALAMGTGIWSMHFIGMLAFSLPIPGLRSARRGTRIGLSWTRKVIAHIK